MSEENVEAVRAGYDHFNRVGEPPGDAFHPDVVLDVPGFGLFRGRKRIAAWVREYAAAFENWQIRPEEIIDAGDHVFAAVRDGGRIKGAETEIFNRFFHVFTFRDGKVVRMSSYLDRDEALEAAGLRE